MPLISQPDDEMVIVSVVSSAIAPKLLEVVKVLSVIDIFVLSSRNLNVLSETGTLPTLDKYTKNGDSSGANSATLSLKSYSLLDGIVLSITAPGVPNFTCPLL